MNSFIDWDDKIEVAGFGLAALFFVVTLTLAAVQPHFEAKAYTRLTGKSVTYWDAVWLDLRVQEGVQEKSK